MAPVPRDALTHRAGERLEGPAADPRRLVRRDVGRVDGSERRMQRTAAGKFSAPFRRVADNAAAEMRQRLSARDGFSE